MARDARILDGDGNPILDGDGNPIYDGGPFEIEVNDSLSLTENIGNPMVDFNISVHDCVDTEETIGG